MNDMHNPNDYATTHSEEAGVQIRKTIWKVFWILLGVTSIEVALGIFYQDWGINFSIVKTTFIVLTLVKSLFYRSRIHALETRKFLFKEIGGDTLCLFSNIFTFVAVD
jgi:hypothetical protein